MALEFNIKTTLLEYIIQSSITSKDGSSNTIKKTIKVPIKNLLQPPNTFWLSLIKSTLWSGSRLSTRDDRDGSANKRNINLY